MPQLQKKDAKRLGTLLDNLKEEGISAFDDDIFKSAKNMLSNPSDKRNDYDMAMNQFGDSLLHIAARSNIVEKDDIDFLVDIVGIDPNRRAPDKQTPLGSALGAYYENVVDLRASMQSAKDADTSVMQAIFDKSSLETIKQPTAKQASAFHLLNDMNSAGLDEGLHETFANRLKGESSRDKMEVLNLKDANGETIFERLMLQKNFDSFDKIHNTLERNEKLESLARGVSETALKVCEQDELEFFSERYDKVSKQIINTPIDKEEVASQNTGTKFKKSEAYSLADSLAKSIYQNKDNPSYGSVEKVKRLANELKETHALKDGVNQGLGENGTGDSLINLAIVMRDKKSLNALAREGADFNDESKRLPINAAISTYGDSVGTNVEGASSQILEETIKRSEYKSILFAKRESRNTSMNFMPGMALLMPTVVGTATSLHMIAEEQHGKDTPELAGKILDRAFELQPESIGQFISMRNSEGDTAAHSFAAKGNRKALIRVLGQEGISDEHKKQLLELENKQGKTPIQEAEKHPETKKYLQRVYDKAQKDIAQNQEVALVVVDEPKKKKGKKSKNKTKNNSTKSEVVVEETKKEESKPEFNVQPEPDLEDMVSQFYSLLKDSSRKNFPKKEVDEARKNINKYIVEKEGGDFEVLDETLNESYNYDTADTYRDKISKELKKFSQDKKVQKVQSWVDGTGGRPNPSLKKEISSLSSKSDEIGEEIEVVQQLETKEVVESVKSPIRSPETKQEDKVVEGVKFITKSETSQKVLTSRQETEPNTSKDEVRNSEKTDKVVQVADSASLTSNIVANDMPVKEVSVQRNSKDSLSTLTAQQDVEKEVDENIVEMSKNSAFEKVEKSENSNTQETAKSTASFEQGRANVESSVYSQADQYGNQGYYQHQPADNLAYMQQNMPPQQFAPQYPVDAYGQVQMPVYNDGGYADPNFAPPVAQYAQEGFIAQQGYVAGYGNDMYMQPPMPPMQQMQQQMMPQFTPQAQMYDPYNQASGMGYPAFVDPNMQYAYMEAPAYGYGGEQMQNVYNQQQDSQKQADYSGKDIESLKADEASLLKAAESIRKERQRLENEERKSSVSSLASRSNASSIKQIVQEGKKSPLQHAQQEFKRAV